MFSKFCLKVFNQSIEDYHVKNSVNEIANNPYKKDDIEHLLYQKNWIDTVQWHLEDLIRDPEIDPIAALKLKRTIDHSNQQRTDLVEYIDSYFLDTYKKVDIKKEATFNSESPAWAIDRLSILSLKIFHMAEETTRSNASAAHVKNCQEKLDILNQQNQDLCKAIDQLLKDIESGEKYMRTYKQMKMYNDEDLNPVLYKSKK
ncbi:DUF4254 domain-containing protein [Flavobacteriaceae bacterium]|jgi:hypothetical protein|nr:DUF4254 domain-containing protein [Flavobacteriaceae bacterium]|tara:strand:- start:188 stop:793 length:606 start_codon:yes stop_codon:yes gene_type:complete